MNGDFLVKSMQIPPNKIQLYERYLPTAFDESLSLLEKVNKLIEYTNQMGEVSNDLVLKWNDLVDWFLSNGLHDSLDSLLNRWVIDGKFNEIINDKLFNDLRLEVEQKRDKSVKIKSSDLDTSSDEYKIKEINLSEEVKQLIAGVAEIYAEVQDGGVTSEKYANDSIHAIKTTFHKNTINLFDYYSSPDVKGHFDGRIINITDESLNRFTYIKATPNTIYKIQRKNPSYYLSIGYINDEPIDGVEILGFRGLNDTDNTRVTYKTGEGAKYIVLLYYGENELIYSEEEVRKSLQIEKGSNFSEIVDGIILDIRNENLPEKTQYNLFHDTGLGNEYVKSDQTTEVSPAGFGEVEFNIINANISDIYSRYDLDVGEYMNRKLVGYGSSSLGENDFSLPIYEYEIYNPINDVAGVSSISGENNLINVGIVGGLHGNEKGSVYSIYEMVHQMLKNNNDKLNQILSFFKINIIPISNPWGFNNYSRRNARDVDLNRNFSYNWEDGGNYKGSEPYSELESKLLRQWILENEFDFVYDIHNNVMEHSVYLNSNNSKQRLIFSDFVRAMQFFWKETYGIDVSKTPHHITNWLEGTTGTLAKEVDILTNEEKGAIVEIPWEINGLRFKKQTIEIGVDLISNLLRGMLKENRG